MAQIDADILKTVREKNTSKNVLENLQNLNFKFRPLNFRPWAYFESSRPKDMCNTPEEPELAIEKYKISSTFLIQT